MKSEVKNKEKVTPAYPKLRIWTTGKNKGMVVLMWNIGAGVVVVAGGNGRPLGYTSESWDMDYFEDFEGSVTLTNE